MSSTTPTWTPRKGMSSAERFVIFASSIGTVFEWYDFYLYAVLAPFFASLFFPPGNETAALLAAFATYAVGFLVRPFGALIFGRIGDLVGRKYTFLVTIIVMGTSTFLVRLSRPVACRNRASGPPSSSEHKDVRTARPDEKGYGWSLLYAGSWLNRSPRGFLECRVQ